MKLVDYHPQSKLVVPTHFLPKAKFPVIDAHTHFGALLLGENYTEKYDTGETVHKLRECGIQRVINLDFGYGKACEKMLTKMEGYEDFFLSFGTVPVEQFEEPDFERRIYQHISDGVRLGMRGLKLWKPIGLQYTDKNGNYLRPDDPRLQVIYQTAGEFDLPILFHIADPIAFFDPLDSSNERYEELASHPDWSFSDSKYYRFDALMQMQENMLRDNPGTTFIIAHVGSCAEDLSRVANWLERYPNMYIDIAARISELGRQPYTARDFLEKYSDRVVFGTDYCPIDAPIHPTYFRFLETFDEYFNPQGTEDFASNQGRWNIYGVGLSDNALRRIYAENICKLLRISVP